MKSLLIAIVPCFLLMVASGCSTKSSGGSSGVQQQPAAAGDNAKAAPGAAAQAIGGCIGKSTIENVGEATVCTEFLAGEPAITAEQIQQSCAQNNQQYAAQCPTNPIVTCRLAAQGINFNLKVYAAANTRDALVKQCQEQNGQLQ